MFSLLLSQSVSVQSVIMLLLQSVSVQSVIMLLLQSVSVQSVITAIGVHTVRSLNNKLNENKILKLLTIN